MTAAQWATAIAHYDTRWSVHDSPNHPNVAVFTQSRTVHITPDGTATILWEKS